MKKHLFVLAALSATLYSSAFSFAGPKKLMPELKPDLRSVEIPATVEAEPVVTSRTDAADNGEEVYYSLAGDPATALSFNGQEPGMQMAMAFQIDPQFVSGLTDGKITGISFYTGTLYDDKTKNLITKYNVFITDNLTGDFLYTQQATAPGTAFTKVDVTLDTPFEITPDKNIYVGVYFTINNENNVPVVVDYTAHMNEYGGWVATRANSLKKWSWDNIASAYGFMTLGATVSAANLPKDNVSVLAVEGQPVVNTDEPFSFNFLLANDGVNTVKNISVEYGIAGESSVTETYNLKQEWNLNQMIILGIENFVATNEAKSSEIVLKVTEVNGKPNNSPNNSEKYDLTVVKKGNGSTRNVVVDELTSISCVYCPVGYTAMEQIHDEATDGSVIPVCIHINSPGRDPMTATSYANVANTFCNTGVPDAIISRSQEVYPYYDNIMEMVNAYKTLPGIACVEAQASLDKETRILTIDTKTAFAFDYTDGDKNFRLAYGITENNVGPYSQRNGYSGQQSVVPGDWQNMPSTVDLVYNDVARQLDNFSGIKGSIPSEIEVGKKYEYSHDIKLLQAIKDLDNINVVVYLLNYRNKSIENACILKAAGDGSFTGIESVVVDNPDAPVEYFNIQGVRVANPGNGLYIRRQGTNVSKVLIK